MPTPRFDSIRDVPIVLERAGSPGPSFADIDPSAPLHPPCSAIGGACSLSWNSMTGIARHQASDPDEFASALAGWSQDYTQLGRGRLQGELLQVALPDASLIYERSNLHMHENMSPPRDQVVIAIPLSLSGEPLFNGQRLSRDTLVLLRGGEEVEISAPGDFCTIGLTLGPRLLAQELRAEEPDLLERALSRHLLPLSPQAAQGLRENLCGSLGAFAREEWCLSDPRRANGAALSALEEVLQVIFGALRSPVPHTPGTPRALQQRRRLVLAAIEYMQQDLSQPLSLQELCDNLHTSQRTLQYCFRQICQTTPQQFFLALRLAEARRRLKQEPQQSITHLALDLGFASSSHFSSLYKRLYAEQPSLLVRQR
ncbi:HTH-type transcriptional activator RhaS [compost metagenome]